MDDDDPDNPEVRDNVSDGGINLLSKDEAELRVQKHLILNQNSKIFSCNLCDGVFTSKLKKIMIVHILKHLNIYVFQCDECGRKFRQMCNYTRHMKTHRERGAKCRKMEGLKNNKTSQIEKYSNRTELEVPDICKLTQPELHGKLIR